MFDKYVVVDGSLRNVTEGGRVTGYRIDLRLPYYRGLELSAVTVELRIDGAAVDPAATTLTVHGNSYRLTELPTVLDDRWPFTEAATVSVDLPGGLRPGDHTVTGFVHVRIAYHRPGFEATNTKTLAVA